MKRVLLVLLVLGSVSIFAQENSRLPLYAQPNHFMQPANPTTRSYDLTGKTIFKFSVRSNKNTVCKILTKKDHSESLHYKKGKEPGGMYRILVAKEDHTKEKKWRVYEGYEKVISSIKCSL